MWSEVTGAGRDCFRDFSHWGCWDLGFFFPLSEGKPHTGIHMSTPQFKKTI